MDVADARPSPFGARLAVLQEYAPGILASVTIAMAATFLADHYGGPVMLFALLLGMAFSFLSQDGRCVSGIEVASKWLLRLAVGLLGAQVTIGDIARLGVTPIAMVIAGVVLTLGFGLIAARAIGLSRNFALLTASAVAICGASAALAVSAVLPQSEHRERDTAFTVIGVTTLSTVAMIVYPMIIAWFHLDHAAVGVFLGGTIHDVAQVVGAGFSVSQETGTVATFTKLLRVAMLVPVVMGFALAFGAKGSNAAGRRPPGFLVLFIVLVAISSTGVIPAAVLGGLNTASRWCLVTAIAALGTKTSLKTIATVGGRPVALIVAETLFLAVFVLAVVLWRF